VGGLRKIILKGKRKQVDIEPNKKLIKYKRERSIMKKFERFIIYPLLIVALFYIVSGQQNAVKAEDIY